MGYELFVNAIEDFRRFTVVPFDAAAQAVFDQLKAAKVRIGTAMLGDLLLRTGDIPGARSALTEAVRLDKRWAGKFAMLPPLEIAPPPREVKP